VSDIKRLLRCLKLIFECGVLLWTIVQSSSFEMRCLASIYLSVSFFRVLNGTQPYTAAEAVAEDWQSVVNIIGTGMLSQLA
jgi:hypothetical protein